MSLLTICQKAARRLDIPAPTAVVSSTDTIVQQLFELANEEGTELARRYAWQALIREQTFITVAQAEQTNTPVPGDLDRFVENSFFNRTTQRRLIGPITPQEWQAIQATPLNGRIYLAFRQRDGAFLVTPNPTAGDTVGYEYVTANWAMSSAGVGKPEFTADEDTAALDEELIVQGLRWRWKQAKGLDYGEDMATYERNVSRKIGADGGATVIFMGQRPSMAGLAANIPEVGYGQ